jgi:hypothetical protein
MNAELPESFDSGILLIIRQVRRIFAQLVPAREAACLTRIDSAVNIMEDALPIVGTGEVPWQETLKG